MYKAVFAVVLSLLLAGCLDASFRETNEPSDQPRWGLGIRADAAIIEDPWQPRSGERELADEFLAAFREELPCEPEYLFMDLDRPVASAYSWGRACSTVHPRAEALVRQGGTYQDFLALHNQTKARIDHLLTSLPRVASTGHPSIDAFISAVTVVLRGSSGHLKSAFNHFDRFNESGDPDSQDSAFSNLLWAEHFAGQVDPFLRALDETMPQCETNYEKEFARLEASTARLEVVLGEVREGEEAQRYVPWAENTTLRRAQETLEHQIGAALQYNLLLTEMKVNVILMSRSVTFPTIEEGHGIINDWLRANAQPGAKEYVDRNIQFLPHIWYEDILLATEVLALQSIQFYPVTAECEDPGHSGGEE